MLDILDNHYEVSVNGGIGFPFTGMFWLCLGVL